MLAKLKEMGIAKAENGHSEDTFSFGDTFFATPEQMFTFFGEPQHNRNVGWSKTNFEWSLSLNGFPFSVYDWKEYRVLDMGEAIWWRIASNKREVSLEAASMINDFIDSLP